MTRKARRGHNSYGCGRRRHDYAVRGGIRRRICRRICRVAFAGALGNKIELLGNGMAVVVHSYVAGAAVVVYVLFVAFVSSAPFVVLLVALLVVVTLPAPGGAVVELFMRGNGVVAQGFAGWLRKVLYYYNLAFFFSVKL